MQQRVSIITLGVSDLEVSKQFYINGLGWEAAASSNDNIIFFQLGGFGLALYSRTALADDAHVVMEGDIVPPLTLAYNVEETQIVDQVLTTVQTIGGVIVKPAQKVFWGGYSGYFKDPDGFLWEVAYNPYFTLDADGSLQIP